MSKPAKRSKASSLVSQYDAAEATSVAAASGEPVVTEPSSSAACCVSCRYFKLLPPSTQPEEIGQCRRFPPSFRTFDLTPSGPLHTYLVVGASSPCCGEYSRL